LHHTESCINCKAKKQTWTIVESPLEVVIGAAYHHLRFNVHPFLHTRNLDRKDAGTNFPCWTWVGWVPSQLWEFWSKIVCWMPFLTQTQLIKQRIQFLAGSLALGTSTNSQGSQSKRLLIQQYNEWPLISQLASTIWRPSFQSAAWRIASPGGLHLHTDYMSLTYISCFKIWNI